MIITVAFLLLGVIDAIQPHRLDAYSWYSTIGELRNMISMDSDLLKLLQKRAILGKYQLSLLQRKIVTILRSGKHMLHEFYKNGRSVMVTDLVARYKMQWSEFAGKSAPVITSEFFNMVRDQLRRFPQTEDMLAVLKALIGLQKSYNLKTTDLARGYIYGQRVGNRLSISSCEYIMNQTCEDGPTELCLEWANVTKGLIMAGEEGINTLDQINDLVRSETSKKKFSALCASAVADKDRVKTSKKLKCSMWTNYGHPWLILQPVAMETISLSPDVAVFYNVISDQDIDRLQSIAIKKLESAKTFELQASFEVDSYRVAHNCWLSKRESPVLPKLDALVSAITGLRVKKTAEQLQVANYGIGGHYGPHTDPVDYTPEEEIKRRNRKATFMFYLSDVEEGGATVFVDAGVAVKPVKGSAVFWHNLLPSGEVDERTTHGSCPVLLGDKWVANKWIWETTTEICKLKEYIGRLH